MTNSKLTKRALLTSSISLLLCFAMLLGTTFAWFTDSVTSANNIITAGNLDVKMYWADGKSNPADATWTDASQGAIFNYGKWEPGYVDVKHIKIANEGSLALKYQIAIVANGEVSKLSDVIDVYYADPAIQVADRIALTDSNKIGTLTEVLAAMPESTYGDLASGNADVITLALKMQEEAGNEYQNLSIGADFSVILSATQLTSEEDSFDNQYDKDAFVADVYVATEADLLAALEEADPGEIIGLTSGVTVPSTSLGSNAYGATGLSINNGQIFDGGNNTFGAKAYGTWDSAINITGGTIKNVTINEGFRGIFINHNSSYKAPVILENVIVRGPTYTISCDQGTNSGLKAFNSKFYGWTSYAATIGNVEFTNCTFGAGAGYNFSRPYAPTTYINCEFESGHQIDARAAVAFENCTLNGVSLTDANLADLVVGGISNVIVK